METVVSHKMFSSVIGGLRFASLLTNIYEYIAFLLLLLLLLLLSFLIF